jgi:hypothetical protein
MLASEMKPVKADVSIFSWERIAERMDRTYRKILSENSIIYTIDDGYEK